MTTAAVSAPVSTDIVNARDAAILACLKQGRASVNELLAAMPAEHPPLDEEARRVALSRSLGRLRIKTRQVKSDGTLWELT